VAAQLKQAGERSHGRAADSAEVNVLAHELYPAFLGLRFSNVRENSGNPSAERAAGAKAQLILWRFRHD
jgi:hypothetical protein